MMPSDHAIFSLQQARDLLPHVKHVTADAVRQAETLAAQLNGVAEDDPEHASLSAALRDGGWLRLAGLRPAVRRAVDATNLDRLLSIHATVDDARPDRDAV